MAAKLPSPGDAVNNKTNGKRSGERVPRKERVHTTPRKKLADKGGA